MQAIMPQKQHMLTNHRGRILMLLRSFCNAHVLVTTSCQASMNLKVLEPTVLRQVLFGDISRGAEKPHLCEKVGHKTQVKVRG